MEGEEALLGAPGCPRGALDAEAADRCREWASRVAEALGGVTFYDDGSTFEAYSAYRLAAEHGVGREDRVFFAGAYHNSALQLFARLGYRRVVGMDYHREVYDEPYYWGGSSTTGATCWTPACPRASSRPTSPSGCLTPSVTASRCAGRSSGGAATRCGWPTTS